MYVAQLTLVALLTSRLPLLSVVCKKHLPFSFQTVVKIGKTLKSNWKGRTFTLKVKSCLPGVLPFATITFPKMELFL